MNIAKVVVFSALAISALLCGCSQMPDVDADVKALREYICAPTWNIPRAELDGVLKKYFGDDVIVYWPNRPALSKTELLEMSKSMTADVNFTFKGTTTNLEVARAGDLAYCSGAYTTTITDGATNNVVTDTGYWETVFKKREGVWKAVTDIHSPDHP
jgi:ketosteroid isomerase-like protein